MKPEIFTFCDFAQESGGKLTVVGTFDTIIARTFPCVHPQLSVVIRIRFNIGEFTQHNFRIEIRDLDGESCIAPVSGTINVNGVGNATAVSHLVFGINNLRFTSPSVINFTLYIDNKEIDSIPLYVRKGQAAKQESF
ncbi:MAG: hypothetical protein LBD44_02135 [Spirochaetaceae bacterium]|jgi:hypothetical protein|nr:hypothetical protein [Spirochaetaceae bacterium]